jgi:hypothetical protein
VVIPTLTRRRPLDSQRPVPSPLQIDSELFKAKISNTLCLLPRTPFLKTSAVEELIATITSTIANVAHASKINLPRPCTVKRCLGGQKNSALYAPKPAPISRRGPNVKLHKARCNSSAANPRTIVLSVLQNENRGLFFEPRRQRAIRSRP